MEWGRYYSDQARLGHAWCKNIQRMADILLNRVQNQGTWILNCIAQDFQQSFTVSAFWCFSV